LAVFGERVKLTSPSENLTAYFHEWLSTSGNITVECSRDEINCHLFYLLHDFTATVKIMMCVLKYMSKPASGG